MSTPTQTTEICRCRFCGKATTERAFFTIRSGCVRAHLDCMISEGKKAVASGVPDDVRIAMTTSDGAATITSSKKLRENR